MPSSKAVKVIFAVARFAEICVVALNTDIKSFCFCSLLVKTMLSCSLFVLFRTFWGRNKHMFIGQNWGRNKHLHFFWVCSLLFLLYPLYFSGWLIFFFFWYTEPSELTSPNLSDFDVHPIPHCSEELLSLSFWGVGICLSLPSTAIPVLNAIHYIICKHFLCGWNIYMCRSLSVCGWVWASWKTLAAGISFYENCLFNLFPIARSAIVSSSDSEELVDSPNNSSILDKDLFP